MFRISTILKRTLTILFSLFVLESYHKFRERTIHKTLPRSIDSTHVTVTRVFRPYCECSEINREYMKIQITSREDELLSEASQVEVSLNRVWNKSGKLSLLKTKLWQTTLKQVAQETITCDVFNTLKRGKHQKVISFSIDDHDDDHENENSSSKKNLTQIVENAINEIGLKYKGFTARLYHDRSIDSETRCHVECKYADLVDFCNIGRFPTSLKGLIEDEDSSLHLADMSFMRTSTWRILPIGDTYVDLFMSRNVRSHFIAREIESVNVWLQSNNYGHIMRDHKFHDVEILGDLWGAHTSLNRSVSTLIFRQLVDNRTIHEYKRDKNDNFYEYSGFDSQINYNVQERSDQDAEFDDEFPYGDDQPFLSEHVYKWIRNESTIHDSYSCEKFKDSRPFPTQRHGSYFVGYTSGEISSPNNLFLCPLACRPQQHKDWKFC